MNNINSSWDWSKYQGFTYTKLDTYTKEDYINDQLTHELSYWDNYSEDESQELKDFIGYELSHWESSAKSDTDY